MRVVVAGASGLIGKALVTELRAHGHEVTTLVRGSAGGPQAARWDPARGVVDSDVVGAAEAVICLSGANVGAKRWTPAYKREIVDSRVNSVGTLARTIARLENGPRVLLAASAVGYYGDTGDQPVTEVDTASGDSFLVEVCRRWEAAADPARAAGIRVAHLRTGLVLAPDADLVKRLRLITKLGIAGPLGSGRQYMPWVSLADEVAAIEFLLTSDVSGPVNITAPSPVPNREFMKTLGRVLHRPTVVPTPGFGLRIVLGEFAEDVLTGQRALPAVLRAAGYEFRDKELEPALRAALGA